MKYTILIMTTIVALATLVYLSNEPLSANGGRVNYMYQN